MQLVSRFLKKKKKPKQNKFSVNLREILRMTDFLKKKLHLLC